MFRQYKKHLATQNEISNGGGLVPKLDAFRRDDLYSPSRAIEMVKFFVDFENFLSPSALSESLNRPISYLRQSYSSLDEP